MFERTASLWRRLIGRGQPGSESADGGDERRVWMRYPSDVMTQLAPLNGEVHPGLSARVKDVSLGGIKLVSGEAFEPGTMVSLTLPGEGKSSMTVLACVVHCREVSGGEWVLGCSFAAELQEWQLLAFGARQSVKTGTNGRQWARYPCSIKAVCRHASQPELPPWEAEVFNVSASGMAVKFNALVSTGTLFSAELRGTRAAAPLTILACVVHVTVQPDGQRILWCNFIRELSTQDIQLLV
jgi:PilZ domain